MYPTSRPSLTDDANSFAFRNTLAKIVDYINRKGILATTATEGFDYIATCNGPPTGIPKTITGRCAMVYDIANNDLYVYNGGWKSVTLS